ncbi:cupin domain-containing protein [Consotaella salsifontis]|uniref:Uncharacterized protein YjlB n=1 Tax=Consotaella salsifontis TaxID=1365950 RepID=A0A1T4L1T0_9HYPH|nr:cupin domain-containing protein [Consotaella salsifontis]SJZ48548.1 Uncharacterized protein YjlB [Consotaella salsifontis]
MRIERHQLSPENDIPNSPLPLILARGAVAMPTRPEAVEEMVRGNGWTGTWVYTVYDYWHYHVTGHELLICVAGTAELGFGGPHGIRVEVAPGDMAVLPAGTGHRRFSASADFAMVGAYPPGQDGSITRVGAMDTAEAAARIARLALPQNDPLTGERPGIFDAWRGRGEALS